MDPLVGPLAADTRGFSKAPVQRAPVNRAVSAERQVPLPRPTATTAAMTVIKAERVPTKTLATLARTPLTRVRMVPALARQGNRAGVHPGDDPAFPVPWTLLTLVSIP